jgi:hypothetical protein
MKKGLTLALTMLALTMLVVPASAVAPIIPQPPTIIIGNADDMSTTTGKSLFRYLDAIDLSTFVDWQNPTYSDQTYRAYASFATDLSGITVKVSGPDSWIDGLTASETSSLVNDGVEPPAAKNILGAASTISLMNVSASTGDPASAFLADPDTNGLETFDAATYQPDMAAEPTVMWLAAAVTNPDGGLKVSAPALVNIYSLLDQDDAWDYSQYAYVSDDPGATWVGSVPAAEGSVTKPGTLAPAGVCGYDVAAVDDPANKIIFGQFQLGDGSATIFPIAGAGMADKLYNARVRLRNPDAPSADLCPGYRIEYTNNAYTHFGGIEVNTYDDNNAPYAGHDHWAQVYWEVPYEMTEMADGGQLSDWYFGHTDFRNYTLLFDLFHKQLGDRGLLTAQEVVVEAVDKPTAASSSLTYADMTNWIQAKYAASDPNTFQDGVVTEQTADHITMTAGGGDATPAGSDPNGNRFIQVNPPVNAASFTTDNMHAVSDTLYQVHCDAQSLDVETTPLFRMYVECYDQDGFAQYLTDPTAYYTNIIWFDIFGALEPYAKQPDYWAGRQSGQNPPGVPPDDAPVTASVWLWSHTQGPNCGLMPEVSVHSLNNYLNDAGWQDDDGGVTISNVGVNAY